MQLKPGQTIIATTIALFICVPSLIAQDEVAFAKKLVGSWEFDIEKSTDLTDEEKADMADRKITASFSADGNVVMSVGGREREGNYKLKAVEGNDKKYTITIEFNGSGRDAELIVINDNEIKIAPEDDPAIVFVRQNKDGEQESEMAEEEKQADVDPGKMTMDDIKKMVVGSWRADAEATRNYAENEGKEIERVPSLAITMNEDGTAKVGEEGRDDMDAKYSIQKKEEGEGLELVTTVEEDERAFEFKVVDKDHFAMRPRSNMPFFVFKRQK